VQCVFLLTPTADHLELQSSGDYRAAITRDGGTCEKGGNCCFEAHMELLPGGLHCSREHPTKPCSLLPHLPCALHDARSKERPTKPCGLLPRLPCGLRDAGLYAGPDGLFTFNGGWRFSGADGNLGISRSTPGGWQRLATITTDRWLEVVLLRSEGGMRMGSTSIYAE